MIDRVLAKDIDLDLMETLTSKRVAIKKQENISQVEDPVPQARGSGETIIENQIIAIDENVIKPHDEYNNVLREIGLNSEIR